MGSWREFGEEVKVRSGIGMSGRASAAPEPSNAWKVLPCLGVRTATEVAAALQGTDWGGDGMDHGWQYHIHLPFSWCSSFQGSQRRSLDGAPSKDQPLGAWGWDQPGSGGTNRIISRVISSPVVFLAIVLRLSLRLLLIISGWKNPQEIALIPWNPPRNTVRLHNLEPL